MPNGRVSDPTTRLDGGLELAPFRAAFLDPRLVDLGAVVCPPYDVVEPDEDRVLRRRSPYNAVHLVRPRMDETPAGNVYEHAADLIGTWRSNRVLRRDAEESLYVYEQEIDGHRLRGLIGAVGVRDDATRVVLPHEEVFPGPVADRLALMEATDAQLEPILLAHVGGAGELHEVLERVNAGPPWLTAEPPDASTHRVWRLSDPAGISDVAAALGGTQALIADGHHRYATYQRLQHERRAAGRGAGPWDFGLALLVDTAPGGLDLGAIHRTVHGVTMTDALAAAGHGVGVEPLPAIGREADLRGTAARLAGLASGPDHEDHDPAITVVVSDGVSAARLRIRPAAADRRSSLAATVVSEWLLPRVFGCSDDSSRVAFHHEARHALAAARAGSVVAVLLPAPDLADVVALAGAGQRMPRKSTSFGPKPRSGLVLRFLD